MSKYGKGIISRLHPLSPLHDTENDGHKVIDNTIGEYLDHYESRNLAYQFFILHATGKYLDLHGEERGVYRKDGESDEAYRARILLEKGMYNCLEHFRQYGVEFWDYVDNFAEGSQNFYVQVFDETTAPRQDNKVTLNIYNPGEDTSTEYVSYTNIAGVATFNLPLANVQWFNIIVEGDDEYNPVVATMNRVENVSWKRNTIILCNDSDIIRYKNFNVQLLSENGVACANLEVKISVNGVTYSKLTNDEGIASLNIKLREGDYEITYSFDGDDEYNPANGSTILHNFSDGGNNSNLLINVGLVNDLSSSALTSKNTYLNRRYFAHANINTQRKLQQKFINREVTWF